ncbi:hypothetical protein COOONC_18732 [Cooperia oncophora]
MIPIAKEVRMLNDWPRNLRHDKDSIRLYQELLNRADVLKIPHAVRQVKDACLFIPASNADPERSFSTVNRLTRTDRNNLGVPMLDALMRVHRDGPSLLTVKPKNLVRQWMTPLPGLDLRPHMPSTFRDTDALLDLYVTHYMTKNRLNDRHDAQKIIKLRRELETSKAMIFSSGVLHDKDV